MLRVRNVNLYLHRALQCNVVYVEVLVVLIIAYFHFTISSYLSSVIRLSVWSNQQKKMHLIILVFNKTKRKYDMISF